MKKVLDIALSFGLTSGIITTLGLIVGLSSGTSSRLAVIGGIMTIAIADAFSDALGIHASEDAQGELSHKDVWMVTFLTFATKFTFSSSFIIPILALNLQTAVIVSVIWGLLVLIATNYFIAKRGGKNPIKTIIEHLAVTALVILAANFVGSWIAHNFGDIN